MAIEVSGVAATTQQKTDIRTGLGATTHHGAAANEAAMVALASAVVGDACTRTDTGTVWILATAPYSTAGNWQDTGNVTELAAKVGYRAPIVLVDGDFTAGNINLVASAYANRLVQVNVTSDVTVTIQDDTTGGSANDDSYAFVQAGTGKVTPTAGAGVTFPASWGYVKATRRVGDIVQFQRMAANSWRPVMPENPIIILRSNAGYTTPADTVANECASFTLPPLLPNSRVEISVHGAGDAGAGTKTLVALVNADNVASNTQFTSTSVNGTAHMGFRNTGTTISQKATQSNSTASAFMGPSTNGFLTSAIQTNVSTTLSITVQKGTAADVFTVEQVEVRVYL